MFSLHVPTTLLASVSQQRPSAEAYLNNVNVTRHFTDTKAGDQYGKLSCLSVDTSACTCTWRHVFEKFLPFKNVVSFGFFLPWVNPFHQGKQCGRDSWLLPPGRGTRMRKDMSNFVTCSAFPRIDTIDILFSTVYAVRIRTQQCVSAADRFFAL